MKILVYMSFLYALLIPIAANDEYSIMRISGIHSLKQMDLVWNNPAQANIWDVGNDSFMVTVWPPRYCHGVYLCPIKQETYNDNNKFVPNDTMCTNEYVLYLPVKNTVTYQKGKNTQQKFVYGSHLIFDFSNGSHTIKSADRKPNNARGYNRQLSTGQGIRLSLTGQNLLVMTNSRFCEARVISSSKAPVFYPIPAPKSLVGKKWFWDGLDAISHTFQPSNPKNKKTDILAPIFQKTYTLKGDMIGKVKLRCNNFSPMDISYERKTKELSSHLSVHSIRLETEVSTVAKTMKRQKVFEMSVHKCSWARIWVAPEGKKLADYKDMKPEETVDFFFNDRFIMTPDSEEARPLALHSEDMEIIQFRLHMGSDTKGDIIEMSYGPHQMTYGYSEYFHFPQMTTQKVNLHVIRAPGCDLSVVNEVPFVDFAAPDAPYHNLWKISDCDFNYLAEEK